MAYAHVLAASFVLVKSMLKQKTYLTSEVHVTFFPGCPACT